MIDLKKILVPTDFSEYSQRALCFACSLAEKFHAELHLLHVLQDFVALVPEPGMAFPPPGDYLEEMRQNAQRSLEKLPPDDWNIQVSISRSVRQGPPFLEIVRLAKDENFDLIVIGTHGRSGLAHVLLGSVTEKVVRKASCPVLTVKDENHHFEMP